MTLPLMRLTVIVSTVVAQNVPIRHVPKVDAKFERRNNVCSDAPRSDATRTNDTRDQVGELFGHIRSIEIHQFGPKFLKFDAVETYVRDLLARRPRYVAGHIPWANATPLSQEGVLGTIRYANGASGVLEATGPYVCVQDAMSHYWWFRLAPHDVW